MQGFMVICNFPLAFWLETLPSIHDTLVKFSNLREIQFLLFPTSLAKMRNQSNVFNFGCRCLGVSKHCHHAHHYWHKLDCIVQFLSLSMFSFSLNIYWKSYQGDNHQWIRWILVITLWAKAKRLFWWSIIKHFSKSDPLWP